LGAQIFYIQSQIHREMRIEKSRVLIFQIDIHLLKISQESKNYDIWRVF